MIGVCTLCRVVELVDGKIDERGEISVVDGMGIGVVRHHVKILDALNCGDGAAMVIGIRYIVVVVLKTSAQGLQAGAQGALKERT